MIQLYTQPTYQPNKTAWVIVSVSVSFDFSVNTKVDLRFHVMSAQWIPYWIRMKLLEKVSGFFAMNAVFFDFYSE